VYFIFLSDSGLRNVMGLRENFSSPPPFVGLARNIFVAMTITVTMSACSSCDEARLVAGLRGQHLVDIACGPSHSTALTAVGQLYVWGSSIAQSLSPSTASSCKVSTPLLISPGSARFVQVACGSGDCAVLLLYSSGCPSCLLFVSK